MKKLSAMILTVAMLLTSLILTSCGANTGAQNTLSDGEVEAAQILASVIADIRSQAEAEGNNPDEAVERWMAEIADYTKSASTELNQSTANQISTTPAFILPEKPEDPAIDAEALNQIIQEIKAAADEAEFNPDIAMDKLEDRAHAYEMQKAIDGNDAKLLNWVFARVDESSVTTSYSSGRESREVVVTPIVTTLTSVELPEKLLIHSYAEYFPDGELEVSDLVLFAFDNNTISTDIKNDEAVTKAYVYFVTVNEQ